MATFFLIKFLYIVFFKHGSASVYGLVHID